MKNGRNVATTAAIACVLSAPLAIGPYAARADEVSDLRANQELLQQRIDQLAQARVPGNVYGVGSPPGPTTVQMMGGSFPRSFLIPGTDTSIRVGGEIRENLLYWFDGANPNGFSTNPGSTGQVAGAPTGGAAAAKGHALFFQTPQQSKVNFETRTPTAWGEARTFMEFDWAGDPGTSQRILAISDNLGARLRFAYASLGGFLAGQANSNFSDSDAGLETISFSGLVGGPGVARVPQVRYTMPLAGWGVPGALSFSAESAETDVWMTQGGNFGAFAATTPAIGYNPLKTPAPDLTAAWYIPQPWGHLDFSLVVRPGLQVKDGLFTDRDFVGYGGHFSGDVKPHWFGWDKDYIVFNFVAGEGIGRYESDSSNTTIGLISNYTAALAKTAAGAATIAIHPVSAWGGNVGYRHQWTPNIRSNIGWGIYHQDISLPGSSATNGTGGINTELMTAVVSTFWSPVPFVDVGLEYFWGQRTTVSGLQGRENVLESLFKVKF